MVHCPRCHSDRIYRHGKTLACPHVFQLTYMTRVKSWR
ncbi:IS1 family transposase [Aeromonas popoffii]